MRFENSDYTARKKFSRLIVMLLCGVSAAITAMLFKNPFLITTIITLIVIAFVLFNVIRFRKKYNYIFFCDEWNVITLRFYHIVMFSKKYKSFEIPVSDFYKYDIVQNQGGYKELVLYKKDGNKLLKFPAVSLSSLREDEIKLITDSLDSFKKQ